VAVCTQKVPNSLQAEFVEAPQLAAGGYSECWTYIMKLMMKIMTKLFVNFTSVKIVCGPEEGMT